MYTVKQAAGILGISVHTVRYYDDKGLIPGTKRNSANQRMFDDDELEWLFVSVTLRKTGLSLAKIKRYITLNRATLRLQNAIKSCRHSGSGPCRKWRR